LADQATLEERKLLTSNLALQKLTRPTGRKGKSKQPLNAPSGALRGLLFIREASIGVRTALAAEVSFSVVCCSSCPDWEKRPSAIW
jgi:hypothetical protein